MTWKKLLDTKRVEAHATSKQELDDLRRAVNRNLRDAAIRGLSADNKFGLAYEAARGQDPVFVFSGLADPGFQADCR